MSDGTEKKLSLKERLALKKAAQQAQGIEGKVTEDFIPEPVVAAPEHSTKEVDSGFDGSQNQEQTQEPEQVFTEEQLAQLTYARSQLTPQHFLMA